MKPQVRVVQGKKLQRLADIQACSRGEIEIALMGYSTLTSEAEQVAAVRWHAVVFDEVHKLQSTK